MVTQPNDYQGWKNQGDVLSELERYEEAIVSYNKAIAIKADYYEAWNNRGMAMGNLGRYEHEIASYDKAIELKPDRYEAWYNKGLVLFNLGRYEDALASYNQLLNIKPDFYQAWYNGGIALDELGCHEQALNSYDKAIAIEPDREEAWWNRSETLRNVGRYEDALASYDQLLKIKPDLYQAWVNRGTTLDKLGRYQEALTSFDRSLSLNSNEDRTWYNRGMALLHLKHYEEALTSFDRGLDLNPSNDSAWNERGNALNELSRYEEALNSYRNALGLNPSNYSAWNGRGNALQNLGRNLEALDSYKSALALNSSKHFAWNGQAAAQYSLGYYAQAIVSFDRALDLTLNQYWQAWGNRGWAIFHLRGYQAALQNWDEGLHYLQPESEHQEGCSVLHHCKGKAHYIKGRRQQYPFIFSYWSYAQSNYQLARQLLPEEFRKQHLEVLQDLIVVCQGFGQTEEAKELWLEGNALLERLLQDTPSPGKKLLLARKFAGFTQLRVDWYVQSGDLVAALELAEKRKNTCLAWFRDGWSDEPTRSPKFSDIQKLLNSQTAAIYWHVSPAAITTFILKHNQPPLARILTADTTLAGADRQLLKFEDWVKKWNDLVEKGFIANATPESRKLEPDTLAALADILDLPAILPMLEDITQLILIPHRDLHLLPLHALFPDEATISYLPSVQVGIDLQQTLVGAIHQLPLLSIEHPETGKSQDKVKKFDAASLLYAEIESAAISQLYQPAHRLAGGACTLEALIQASKQIAGIFHFTGHAYHNINSPADSALLLANTAQLTLRDIFENKLDFSRYHLICLSACETGKTGKQGLIDEFVGLAAGFLAAGASCVVSTLWRVDEISSALIMIRFYQLLGKFPPATALRKAQLWLRDATYSTLAQWCREVAKKLLDYDLLCSESLEDAADSFQEQADRMDTNHRPYSHPYYWAAFTITGNMTP